MDIIYLNGLQLETVIGVYPWERQLKQILLIDLEMGSDVSRAAATDQIADALDYKAVTKRLMNFAEESSFQLVETFAERVATIVQEEFAVPWLRLRINKKSAVRGVRDVGVLIERGKSD
jgi:dihydroneopterin aldolase